MIEAILFHVSAVFWQWFLKHIGDKLAISSYTRRNIKSYVIYKSYVISDKSTVPRIKLNCLYK